jgi:diguanylate cyclase
MQSDIVESGPDMFRFPYGNELLRNVVENGAIPTFLVGADGRVFYANRAFGDLLGYTPEEIFKLGIPHFVHPDDAAEVSVQVALLAAGGAKNHRAERRYVSRGGKVVSVLVSARLLTEEHTGKPLYISVQATDIDRQKRAEAALAESEERWNFALEGAGQGVWDHDLKHGKVFFSRMWRQMRGIGPDEKVDGTREGWLARVHPDDRERLLTQAARQNSVEAPEHSFEYRERHRDGHWMWILSRGRPMAWMPDGSIARLVGTIPTSPASRRRKRGPQKKPLRPTAHILPRWRPPTRRRRLRVNWHSHLPGMTCSPVCPIVECSLVHWRRPIGMATAARPPTPF